MHSENMLLRLTLRADTRQ